MPNDPCVLDHSDCLGFLKQFSPLTSFPNSGDGSQQHMVPSNQMSDGFIFKALGLQVNFCQVHSNNA